MSFYGNKFNQYLVTEGADCFETVDYCSYESFIETCVETNYFFESIFGESSILNEASDEKKESVAKRLLNMIQDVWNKFIGKMKDLFDDMIKKVQTWYEEHNINKGVLKVVLKDFSWSDVEKADKKYHEITKEHIPFVKFKEYLLNYDVKDLQYSEELYNLNTLFSKDLIEIGNRIDKIDSNILYGDAKDEYNRILENINHLEKKITNLKRSANLELNNRRVENEYIDKDNYKDKYDSTKYDHYVFQDSEQFFITNRPYTSPDKSEFEKIVSYVENTVKMIHKVKDLFKRSNNYHSFKYIQKDIDDCKKKIKDWENEKNKNTTKVINTFYDTNDHYKEKMTNAAITYNGDNRLLQSKLKLRLAQCNMKLAMKAYKNEIMIIRATSNQCLSYLLELRTIIALINSDRFDIEKEEYNGKFFVINNDGLKFRKN